MRNILLLNPNSPDPPPLYFGPPYGLALIAAYLERDGRIPICLDFERETIEEMINEVRRVIAKEKIGYIGISCQSSNRGYIYRLIKEIRKSDKQIIIILGGPFASQKYELLLNNFPIDYIIIGDGEITFGKLVDCLENGGRLEKVKGLAFLKRNEVVITEERERVNDLDEHPFPAFHLFQVKKRLESNSNFALTEAGQRKVRELKGKRCFSMSNALMLLSSIGCIYGCNFCPMSGIKKGKYREHSPKYFADMVEHFSKMYNQDFFVFGDNFFTRNIARTIEICDEFIKRKLNIEWICMTRTDYVNLKLLKKMKEAGCIEVSFGVETCSEKVQKCIGKNLSIISIKDAFALCEKVKLRSILMLMVGNQGETLETVYETLSVVKDLEPDEILVHTTKVYPGTKIHDLAEDSGLVSDEYYLHDEPTPPPYTLENSCKELKKLKEMFQLRDIKLEINGQCNINCLHCTKNKKKANKLLEQIKNELLAIAKRTNSITFPCAEPAMRKDIMEIIRYANRLDLTRIRLETNGMIFCYRNFTKEIVESGVEKIIVHFFSHHKDKYEAVTQTEGSFDQAIDGLKNLLKLRPGLVTAKIRIFDYNYEDLADMVNFLLDLNVKEFYFEYEPNDKVGVPNLDALETHLRKALLILKKINVPFCVTGVPYCKMADFEEAIDEIHHPFDEIMTMDGDLINVGKERRKKKHKNNICKKCKYDNICEGL